MKRDQTLDSSPYLMSAQKTFFVGIDLSLFGQAKHCLRKLRRLENRPCLRPKEALQGPTCRRFRALSLVRKNGSVGEQESKAKHANQPAHKTKSDEREYLPERQQVFLFERNSHLRH